ncbi:MAG: hypothetical protein LQ338_003039 [Usnochroma carphineum]|nr:MAG: hypothetical protein LQ338_003039 [Usnochroma carphineum]
MAWGDVLMRSRLGIGKKLLLLEQAFYLSQTLYKLTVNATKISTCYLFLRIFPAAQNPRFAFATRLVIAYIFLYMLASVVATVVECVPVQRAWDRGVEGHCIDTTAFWYANAVSNVLGDVLVLGLPGRMVWGLRMRRGDKVGLVVVMGFGVL